MRTDHMAESIQFELVNWTENLDYGAEGWQWFIYYRTTIDPPVVTPITYSVSEDGKHTYLLWEVDHNITKRSGNLDFQIRGKKDTDKGLIEWNSSVATINLGIALDPDDHDTDENVLEWYLDRMEQLAQSGVADITAERDRAMAAEAELREDLDSEIERSITEDNHLQQQIESFKDESSADITRLRVDLTNEITRSTKEDIRLNSALNAEIQRATDAENQLNEDLKAESERAQSVEKELREDLTTETERAKQEERNIKGALEANVLDLTNKIEAETERAQDEERNIHGVIEDRTLQFTNALEAETERATNEETAIRKEMADNVSDITNSINAEAERAKQAEAQLQANIEAENQRAVARENEIEKNLTDALNTETERAEAAEKVLDDKITAETERATEAEATLRSDLTEALNTETERAKAAEAQIQSNLDAEVERAKQAESTLKSDLTAYVDAETERAEAAESKLTSDLQTEVTRATGREEELDAKIDSEINRATLAEQNLQKNLDTAKSELNASIAAEQERAEAAEATLQSNINAVDSKLDSEIERATQAESEMSDRVDILEEGVNSRINQLVTNLNNEITRSTAKDQEHDNEINELTSNLASTDSKLDSEIARSTEIDTTLTDEITSFTIKKIENPTTTVSARYYLELTRDDSQIVRGAYIDIPVTDAVTGGSFDSDTGTLILILANGDQIEVPIGDLVQYYDAADGIQIIRLDETHNAFAIKLNQASGTQGILSTSDNGLAINLSNYYPKGETDDLLSTKQPNLHQQAADPDNRYTPSVIIDSSNTIYVNSQILAELAVAYQLANQNQANIIQLSSTTINGIIISDEDETGLVRKNVILYEGSLVDGQVLIAAGTTGKYKTSGFTINKSVPADAKFTDTTYEPVSETVEEGLFTRVEQEKLENIQAGAEVNVQADWNATDGDAFIKNKPVNATQTIDGFMSHEDKTKLDEVQSGAEVNQNAFTKVTAGDETLSSTVKEDTLILTPGNGLDISGSGKTVTITGVEATQSTPGMMSASDKTKLDRIATGAEVNQNAFSNVSDGTNTASASSKTDTFTIAGGGGTTVTVDPATKKVTIESRQTDQADWTEADTSSPAYIKNKPGIATTTTDGLMSAEDKARLDELDAEYLPLTGGTMTGAINSQNIIPTANNTYDIGSDTNRNRNLYAANAMYLGNPADGKGIFFNSTTGGFDFVC